MSLPTLPPMRVPTLTEVVDWPLVQVVLVDDAPPALPVDVPPPAAAIDEVALTQRILANLRQQVDSVLDHQLRVALQPLLNRLADTLAQQARDEVAQALRDMVALAVSREMIRLRTEAPRSDAE